MSRPRIGLNCDVTVAASGAEGLALNWAYVEAVVRAGGVPLVLPPVSEELLGGVLGAVDGLLLVGGRDYDPALYGRARHEAASLLSPRRMAFDLALARRALGDGLPTLGVCGGAQLVNVALGGTLVQDIPDEVGTELEHRALGGSSPFHTVEVAAGSRLAGIVGEGTLEVNSSHHQAVEEAGSGLRVVARAPDGVIEAVEGVGRAFVLGVQWHPERMLDREEQLALFRALVREAQ